MRHQWRRGRAPGDLPESASHEDATVCHFFPAEREMEFPDDPKRKALAISLAPLSSALRLAIMAAEVFEELPNRR
jgi:hypothetical protein